MPATDIAPKYAEEIERLLAASTKTIEMTWIKGKGLFKYCTPSGETEPKPGTRATCGCLSMVRNGFPAYTDSLTQEIREDERIPKDIMDLYHTECGSDERRTMLIAFAQWQTRLDREIRQNT